MPSFSDDFDGTVDDPLDGRTGWSLQGAEGLDICEIDGANALRTSTDGGGVGDTIYICDGANSPHADGKADHWIEVTAVNPLQANTGQKACIRLVDLSNHIHIRFHGSGAAGVRLFKEIATVETELDSAQPVADHVYRVEIVGNEVEWFDNGVSLGTFTVSDSEIDGEVSTGILAESSNLAPITAWETGYEEEAAPGSLRPQAVM